MKMSSKALAPVILLALLAGCKVTKAESVRQNPTDAISDPTTDPAPATPPPTTDPEPSPSLFGETAIASEFDPYSELTSAPIPAGSPSDTASGAGG